MYLITGYQKIRNKISVRFGEEIISINCTWRCERCNLINKYANIGKISNINEEIRKGRKYLLKSKIKEGGLVAVVVILILAACYGLSWIVTCGIIKLITLCFGLTFKWSIATGIWLVICILKTIFTTTVKSK